MKVIAWYIHAKEEKYLAESIKLMSSYNWIHKIFILHTDGQRAFGAKTDITDIDPSKVVEIFEYFGYSFDKSISLGGFNEVEARNHGLLLAEMGCNAEDWLLHIDSDEFFTYETGAIIQKLHDNGHDSVRFKCHDFYDLTSRVERGPDLHLRAWKAGLKLRYTYNKEIVDSPEYINKSMHCLVDEAPIGETLQKRIQLEYGMHMIHTHDVWKDKHRPVSEEALVKGIDFSWPKNYILAFEDEKNAPQ